MSEKYDIYSIKVDHTKELIKTRPSNSGIRREYQRMRQEQKIRNKGNAAVFVQLDKPKSRPSLTAEDDALKSQVAEPDVKSFPFDNIQNKDKDNQENNSENKETKALAANSVPKHDHGAKLCMMSAMVHMKCLAMRRAKTIRQLRKNPKTSMDEKLLTADKHVEEIEEAEEDDVADLKRCRYLRGVKYDRELTIEEIFRS